MNISSKAQQSKYYFLQGGGEMGELTRGYNWSNHPLGEPETWQHSLRIILNVILNSKFPMFLWWGQKHYCFYNDAYRPSLGNNGKHPSILGTPAITAWAEIWDFIRPLLDQILAGGDAVYFEDLLVPIFRNGCIEDVYWTFGYSAVPGDDATPAAVLVTCTETTQKVKLIKELVRSERRFENLIRDASVGIVILIGEHFKVQIVNKAYGDLIGRHIDELVGYPLFAIIPETETHFRPIIEKVRNSGKPVDLNEYPFEIYKDGQRVSGYLNIIYQPYHESDGTIAGVIVLCQDVTAQVSAQKATETALDQLRLSKDAAQLGLFDMDLEQGTMQWDKRCRTLFGISHDNEVTYQQDFVNGLHPEDRPHITFIIDELFHNPDSTGDYDVEYRTIGAEDRKERWVRAKGKIYYNKNRKPIRFIGSVLDITEKKSDELRKNDFIAMVSHELKTPLTSLSAILQLLATKTDSDNSDFTVSALRRANKQTKKMASLISGFLNISRLESGKLSIDREKFDIGQLLHSVTEDERSMIRSHTLILDDCSSAFVCGDQEKISSVISNLLSNAAKYSPHSTSIEVKCKKLDHQVTVSVRDKGIGIKQADIKRLFERYYRVHNENSAQTSGFGIGLYLSFEIIQMHGGRIWVESEFGKGSMFCFSLPLAEDQ